MNKVKVKIKKLPISNQGSPNFNEMAYQYTSSNPLSFKDLKDSTRMIGQDQYEIGTNYPTEKDPKKANIEAEKGELILTKDFELYKINGKSHKKGGTPLSVNEGDFIFSKKLEGSGKDFNKIFGNFDEKKKYSYADVASRFLKMNDHKVLSTDSNPIDKKTGERMYEDYKDKLGMLAFLQEVSKGLPNGIPAVSAPMIDRLTKSPMGTEPQIPQDTVEGMELPTMEGQETPIQEGQEIPTAGEQMMKMGGPILKKYVEGGTSPIPGDYPWLSKLAPGFFGSNTNEVPNNTTSPIGFNGVSSPFSFDMSNFNTPVSNQIPIDNSPVINTTNLTPEQWNTDYYQPLLKYLKTKYPDQEFNINNHSDYQKLVTENPETYSLLENHFKTDKMKLTNKARKMLKKDGVANADKIQYYSQLPKKYQTPEFLKEQYNDSIAGYRGIQVVPNTESTNTNTQQVQVDPETGDVVPNSNFQYLNPDADQQDYNSTVNPFVGGTPQVSNYRDLGYNTNENMAMLNALQAMTSIPYYSPTRMQNYGLQEGMGLASNLMPYNYQSLINEANRAGMRGFQANNAFSANPNIAAARNAMIAGQLGEQTSKIKGEEYNQNANLYNTNQMQLAQMAGLLGQDKEQQGDLYNSRVVQGRENLWANRKLANKEFIQELANANNNRTMRNTIDYVMQSRDPNYRFANADLMAGFNSFANPFDLVTPSNGNNSDMAQFAKEITQLKSILGNADTNELLRSYQLFKQSRG